MADSVTATIVIRVDQNALDQAAIWQAAKVLLGGGLVAFPTETVYGLGANALDAAAVQRIFVAKGRPASDPLIVHIAALDQVDRVAEGVPALAHMLAQSFWPGPLTPASAGRSRRRSCAMPSRSPRRASIRPRSTTCTRAR